MSSIIKKFIIWSLFSMSGHSKWSTIKRKKEVKDKEKAKIFSKMSRIVTLSVIEGGGITDPEKNVKLRLAVERAKAVNMPKENIKRAIEKGVGPDKDQLKEIVYEGFGPGGVNFIILVTTNNSNRSLTEVRNTLEKNNGKLGTQGSVSYLFKKCGMITFDKQQNSEENIFNFAQKINAFDMEEGRGEVIVYFPFEKMGHVEECMEGLVAPPPEIDYKPDNIVSLKNSTDIEKVLKLIEALEELDDVSQVFANLEISDELVK